MASQRINPHASLFKQCITIGLIPRHAAERNCSPSAFQINQLQFTTPMTQFVRDFYNTNAAREWGRLDLPLCKIEFASTLWLIDHYFPKHRRICDIGGGPGRYSIELKSAEGIRSRCSTCPNLKLKPAMLSSKL